MMFNDLLSIFLDTIDAYPDSNAFCIKGKFYTYRELGQNVSKIRHALSCSSHNNDKVGLVINDDIETYASIFALWLDGNCYVPLHPDWPLDRCADICEQVNIDLILDSSENTRFNQACLLMTRNLSSESLLLTNICQIPDTNFAYLLFTSGSTGKPKGVPISRINLSSFVDAFFKEYSVDSNDRCLQCFDLSFDLSVVSYLVPLLKGACVFTVPSNVIKYSYVGELIDEYKLTFALMAPSIIKYLEPYFDELDCSSMKYSLFCGEALPLDILAKWANCACNAVIDNVYGPTENTIFCSIYRYQRNCENKSHNGVVSIGKPMHKCLMTVFTEDGKVASTNEIGELCLSGGQLTPGYFNNELKNKESFFEYNGIRWYKSGDLCFSDSEGDFMYSGRLDHQVKIQGFRVELGEIEYHIRAYLRNKNVVCMSYDSVKGLTEIVAFVESEQVDTKQLSAYLGSKMPQYMIPTKIICVPVFPLNKNDKTDKIKLKSMIH